MRALSGLPEMFEVTIGGGLQVTDVPGIAAFEGADDEPTCLRRGHQG